MNLKYRLNRVAKEEFRKLEKGIFIKFCKINFIIFCFYL